ncbi:patatin-like phospholipase family protein [Leifsonia sp. NPDC058292]|uniref:patatin-like phospholipase family protein n=1 Tax=Leifsonia sp. NPDC058292 TaxID=3346428 RepID=UPI0036D88F26
MNTTTSARPSADSTAASGRALVLGGGGSLGNAWLIGVVAGLFESGLDVTDADLTVGTSAGSTAAAQLTGASPALLLADILDAALAVLPRRPGGGGTGGGRPRTEPVPNHLERTNRIIAAADGVVDMRRRMGAAALELDGTTDASVQSRWRETVASRLPAQQWPRQTVAITAVDAHSGEPVVFDNRSGVDLVDAVAASCAGTFAYGIRDGRYIDGGYRTNADNADLAAGYAKVLVLSPFGGRSRTPAEWGTHLATQVDALRAGGSEVVTIFPDAAALTVFGDNMMNLSARPAAARAGRAQGNALAGQLGDFWS